MPIVTFVRHAESEYNKKQKFCGRIDCNITKEGKEKAKQSNIAKQQFHTYYCAPQRRTRQTLEVMFPGVKPIEDSRLLTLDLGEWEGKEKSKINQNLVALYRRGKYTPPNGEKPEEIERRVGQFMKEIFCQYSKEEKILVVTSNGVIRAIKRMFLKDDVNVQTDNLGYIVLKDEDVMKNVNRL